LDRETGTPESAPSGSEAPFLRWPPPGLERTQGDLRLIASRAALAGGLLVFPLLFVATQEQDFATFGPFADAWWVTIALASVGLAFAIESLIRVARTMKRAAHALDSGYDATTIIRVLADSSRDMGFLLLGARHFSVMDEDERETVAAMRVTAIVLLALGGLWLIISLCLGFFLAARGLLAAGGLRIFIVLPTFVAYACGTVATLVHEGRVRRARSVWHNQPWSDDLAAEEVDKWKSTSGVGGAPEAVEPGGGRILGRSAVFVGALAVLVVVPVMTLVPATAVGPIITAISMPGMDAYRPRAAQSEAYRSYVVAGDPDITPGQAGQLLHDLTYVGSTERLSAGERPPSRRFAQPWLPDDGDDPNPMGLSPYAWGDSLMDIVSGGVTPAQRIYLEGVAAHRAADDFARLARATRVDVGSARWENPLPSGMTVAAFPLPQFGPLRAAAHARVAMAALALVQGDDERAEQLLSEVISVGFLLADQGPMLIDVFVGHAIISLGGSALEDLYAVTGQATAGAELSRLKQVAERTARLIRVDQSMGIEAWVGSLPPIILDTAVVPGLRWEYFTAVTTVAPCLNLNRMIFGADDDYQAFIEQARESLVRYPSEEGLFEIARYGWVGSVEAANPTLFGRVASLYMSHEDNSCGTLVRHMRAGEVIF
jgi:hypothetical protein